MTTDQAADRTAQSIRVAHITFDGQTLVVPANELLYTIGDDDQNTYAVRFSTMIRAEFDQLTESPGW